MFDLDILAYVVLVAFYASVVVPFFGDLMISSVGSTYKECWSAGAMLHILLIIFVSVIASVLWAMSRVVW